jgi:hypothetical protein
LNKFAQWASRKAEREDKMAILNTAWKRAKGAFKVLMGGAAAFGLKDILTGLFKDKGIELGTDFLRSLATGKGLENEAVYGYILDKCNLKTEERMLLIRAIKELRNGTEKEKEAANNFVIVVSIKETLLADGATVASAATKATTATNKVLNNYPATMRLGEHILHSFIHRIDEYQTEAEKIQMIKDNVIHIGTNAEVKTKVSAIYEWAIEAWNQIQAVIDQAEKVSKDYRRSSKQALKKFKDRPWWKKAFLNYNYNTITKNRRKP